MHAPPPSAALAGRYRLLRFLGEGARGTVYEAVDLQLGRRVAIKQLKPSVRTKGGAVDAFLREAKTLASLKHPNIIDIYDFGELHEGVPCIVMELIGHSLEQHLASSGALPVEEVIALILPLCGALACVHDLGVVHGDLKPENIALERVGTRVSAKLLDFGVAAKLQHDEGTRAIVGTAGYLAPERLHGAPPSIRSDVWSLGVVAFRCLAGRHPFAADASTDLLRATASGVAPPLEEAAPSVPRTVASTIDRALSRDCELRFADMRAFARALALAAAHDGVKCPSDPDPIGLADLACLLSATPTSTERVASAPAKAPPQLRPRAGAGAARHRIMLAALAALMFIAAFSWVTAESAATPLAVQTTAAQPPRTAQPVAGSAAHQRPVTPPSPPSPGAYEGMAAAAPAPGDVNRLRAPPRAPELLLREAAKQPSSRERATRIAGRRAKEAERQAPASTRKEQPRGEARERLELEHDWDW